MLISSYELIEERCTESCGAIYTTQHSLWVISLININDEKDYNCIDFCRLKTRDHDSQRAVVIKNVIYKDMPIFDETNAIAVYTNTYLT